MENLHIDIIEEYFKANGFPSDILSPYEGWSIIAPEKFISGNLAVLRTHSGSIQHKTYYDMLLRYYYLAKEINDKAAKEHTNNCK